MISQKAVQNSKADYLKVRLLGGLVRLADRFKDVVDQSVGS